MGVGQGSLPLPTLARGRESAEVPVRFGGEGAWGKYSIEALQSPAGQASRERPGVTENIPEEFSRQDRSRMPACTGRNLSHHGQGWHFPGHCQGEQFHICT